MLSEAKAFWLRLRPVNGAEKPISLAPFRERSLSRRASAYGENENTSSLLRGGRAVSFLPPHDAAALSANFGAIHGWQ
jgi:hypothetical protein